MTEAEAKTKWCPFASSRVLSYRSEVGNVTIVGTDNENRRGNINCLASSCMAWRYTSFDGGHCGLAGKP